MKQHFENSRAPRPPAVSRILSLREILLAYFCIFLSESVCLFPGIAWR